MKAISRLLIVCLLSVSATGFGLTTTDLSQNSEPDIVICDSVDTVSVIVVDLNMNVEIISFEAMTLSDVSDKHLIFVERFDKVISTIDDVGWQLSNINSNYDYNVGNLQTKNRFFLISRLPRGALSC